MVDIQFIQHFLLTSTSHQRHLFFIIRNRIWTCDKVLLELDMSHVNQSPTYLTFPLIFVMILIFKQDTITKLFAHFIPYQIHQISNIILRLRPDVWSKEILMRMPKYFLSPTCISGSSSTRMAIGP